VRVDLGKSRVKADSLSIAHSLSIRRGDNIVQLGVNFIRTSEPQGDKRETHDELFFIERRNRFPGPYLLVH
jgi:hypothetical protein